MENYYNFANTDGAYYPVRHKVVSKLPVGVYSLIFNSREYRLEAIYTSKRFELPDKLHGFDKDFSDRVMKTYKTKSQNLGILLTGYKGTGKTILGKYICNELDLPVMCLPKRIDTESFNKFLNSMNQDFILFIDEFDKKFGNDQNDLLDLMDGVFNIKQKILFILTTNTMDISEYLLNRPNRIHYIRQFDMLDICVVEDVITELLENKEDRVSLLKALTEFEYVTMDNLISVINEMNRFKVPASDALKYMNISKKETRAVFGLNR